MEGILGHLKSGASEAEIILPSADVGINVLMKLCQKMLEGNGIPADWTTSVGIPIFKGKGDIMNCGMYRGVKLLEHSIKIVVMVLVNRLRKILTMDDMHVGIMPGKVSN